MPSIACRSRSPVATVVVSDVTIDVPAGPLRRPLCRIGYMLKSREHDADHLRALS